MANPRTADDVITLASGEKVVPAPMEDVIRSSGLVRDAVMFGQGRKQVGVLIEPTNAVNDEAAVANFRNQLRAKIEAANSLSSEVAFSRIITETILITKNDKPMIREGETVQPEATLESYREEINNLYDRPSLWTPEDIGQWLLQHARAIGENDGIDLHTDLFLKGFNSLKATRLRERVSNALKHWLNPIQNDVPHNLIYQIPIIQNLGLWIATLVNDGPKHATILLNGQQKKAISDMIKKYSFGPPHFNPASLPTERAVVLLTGSTGGLGSSLLGRLLQDHRVERVFALNRPSAQAIRERQESAFRDRGLPLDWVNSPRITYVEADATLNNCGLSPEVYEEIRRSVTLIIHNAWRVDFNLAISSFEDCIQATQNLVLLGLASHRRGVLRFLFTSSIASASSWDNSKGPFPEEVQPDPSVAVGTGYGASKYVAEQIITSSGLCATSLRIGQISGASNGCWGTADWFPILMISSDSFQRLPEVKGVVSWVDEEYVVAAILDTAFAELAPPPALNLVNPVNPANPESQRFDEVVKLVQEAIIKKKDYLAHDGAAPYELPIIDSLMWLGLLQEKANNPSFDNLERFPAIKLFEFIGSVLTEPDANAEVAGVKCSIDKMKEVSQTVRGGRCHVTKRKAERWVEYWYQKGRIPAP